MNGLSNYQHFSGYKSNTTMRVFVHICWCPWEVFLVEYIVEVEVFTHFLFHCRDLGQVLEQTAPQKRLLTAQWNALDETVRTRQLWCFGKAVFGDWSLCFIQSIYMHSHNKILLSRLHAMVISYLCSSDSPNIFWVTLSWKLGLWLPA